MMLIVLNRDPVIAVNVLISSTPKQFWSKQLIELGQLICSVGISNQFKPISRGKQIQEWIKQFPGWTLEYFRALYEQCMQIAHYQPETLVKLDTIQSELAEYCTTVKYFEPDHFIFRFSSSYKCCYKPNQSLPADECIYAYQKYIVWKCFDKGWK